MSKNSNKKRNYVFLLVLLDWFDYYWYTGENIYYRFWYRLYGFMGTIRWMSFYLWWIDFLTGNSLEIFRYILGHKSKYNSNNSKTSRPNGADFRIAYGDDSYAIGTFINDTVIVCRNDQLIIINFYYLN